jgi:hypothetical protein
MFVVKGFFSIYGKEKERHGKVYLDYDCIIDVSDSE